MWRKYLYAPSPEGLFEATLAREISSIPKCDPDVKNAIIRGIEQSGILNARAIIKARPSLVAIASSTALRKQEIDHSERECTLSRAIELAVLVPANALPKVMNASSSMDKALITIRLEGYEYLQEAFEPLLENHSSNDKDAFIPAAINAETIAKAFKSGSGKIQKELIDFFELKYSHRAFPYNKGTEQSYKWPSETIEYLGRIQKMEKIEEWKRETFIDTLSKIKSDIGQKRQ